MGWNISHVSMKESQSLLHAQSSLHELQSGFAGQSQGRPAWSPGLHWLQDSQCWCGAWTLVQSWGSYYSHQNPALEQSDELWGIQGRLTESLQELSFSGKAQAMSASLSRNSFPLMHQEASQTMHCQTSESSVYRHSRCQALFSEAVAVQTGGWQKFYHSATCMLTNWHIKPM